MIHPDPSARLDDPQADPAADAEALRTFLDAVIFVVMVVATVAVAIALVRPSRVSLPVADWTCTGWRDAAMPVPTGPGIGFERAYDCERWSRK